MPLLRSVVPSGRRAQACYGQEEGKEQNDPWRTRGFGHSRTECFTHMGGDVCRHRCTGVLDTNQSGALCLPSRGAVLNR